jgi:hypothetical protein
VGGRFYTIETDLPMEMMDNSIQVVEPYEIYKASPVADNGWNHYPISADPMMMTDANGVPVLSQPFPMDGMPSEETPQINIAPVIKIINGPDHSTNNGDAAATAGTGAGAPGQTTTIVPTVSTGANNVASVPSKINMSGGTKTGDMPSGTSGGGKSEKDKSLLSNVIDFTKGFFIKKVGA